MILAQVPIPGAETWAQFPVVAVVVLCIGLAGLAVYKFTRWVWEEFKAQRKEELAWREAQNTAREKSVAEQNRLWREAMTERDARYEKYDQQRQAAVQDLATMMDRMIHMLGDHDAQAKVILINTEEIIDNTRPLKSK